jgi:hypothetical protein
MAPVEKPKCRICKKEKCWEHCQEVPDGKHVPSKLMKHIHIADVVDTAPGGYFVVDVNCAACGISGSVKVNFNELEWG